MEWQSNIKTRHNTQKIISLSLLRDIPTKAAYTHLDLHWYQTCGKGMWFLRLSDSNLAILKKFEKRNERVGCTNTEDLWIHSEIENQAYLDFDLIIRTLGCQNLMIRFNNISVWRIMIMFVLYGSKYVNASNFAFGDPRLVTIYWWLIPGHEIHPQRAKTYGMTVTTTHGKQYRRHRHWCKAKA